MNIWIVTIGEPIINNRFNLRLHRSGLLAKYISENTNHKVTFVTSLFNHFTKEFEYKNITHAWRKERKEYKSKYKTNCIWATMVE